MTIKIIPILIALAFFLIADCQTSLGTSTFIESNKFSSIVGIKVVENKAFQYLVGKKVMVATLIAAFQQPVAGINYTLFYLTNLGII
jgi:hypothetical protein